MKLTTLTTALLVAILASSASAQKTSRDEFREFCKALEGRWLGDVKLAADRPGFGKKGEKLTAYAECSVTEDGNAMLARYFAGEGSGTWLICYDAAAKQIKSLWVTSGGIANQSTIRKRGDNWVERTTGSDPDGTKTKFVSTLTITDNGNTHTWTGDGTVGTEKVEWRDVWRRVNK